MFLCQNGDKVDCAYRCDNRYDCDDESDEDKEMCDRVLSGGIDEEMVETRYNSPLGHNPGGHDYYPENRDYYPYNHHEDHYTPPSQPSAPHSSDREHDADSYDPYHHHSEVPSSHTDHKTNYPDEYNCLSNPEGQFLCKNGQLLPCYLRCDGYPQCGDYSDELPEECEHSGIDDRSLFFQYSRLYTFVTLALNVFYLSINLLIF